MLPGPSWPVLEGSSGGCRSTLFQAHQSGECSLKFDGASTVRWMSFGGVVALHSEVMTCGDVEEVFCWQDDSTKYLPN